MAHVPNVPESMKDKIKELAKEIVFYIHEPEWTRKDFMESEIKFWIKKLTNVLK